MQGETKTTISKQLMWVVVLIPLLTVILFFLVSYFWEGNSSAGTNTTANTENTFKLCVTDALSRNPVNNAEITVWKEGKIQGIYNGAADACYLLPANGETMKITIACEGYFTSDTITYVAQAVNYTLALPPLGILQNNLELIDANSTILQDYDSWNDNRKKTEAIYAENLVVVVVDADGVEQEKINRTAFLELITKPQPQIEQITTKVALSNSEQKVYFMVIELKYVGI